MFKKLLSRQSATNSFALLDEAKAPNVKQYLRGLRNYYVLGYQLKVRYNFSKLVE